MLRRTASDAWWKIGGLLVSYRPLARYQARADAAYLACLRASAASGRICATQTAASSICATPGLLSLRSAGAQPLHPN